MSSPTVTSGAPAPAAPARWTAAAAQHLVWHSLPHGEVDHINAAWRAYTGLSLSGARGDGWQRALHPDDLPRWRVAWERSESSGQPCELRCRLRRADGDYGWFLSRVEPIRGPAGEVAGWLGTAIARDDASLAQGRTAILPLEQPATAAGHGPYAFVAAAVHDIKNELTVIRVVAQVLARQLRRTPAVEPERVLTGLARVERSTTKMQKLVEEFFDLARLQSDQPVEFDRQPTDLVALARGCVGEYAPTTNHALSLSTTVESLIGLWDGARLERVVGNLLSNAIKYSAPAAPIHVSLEHDDSGRRDVAMLTVQDHGVGIPAQDLPHIFEPFYRGSNVVDRMDGTGIGLFGARAIVEQQGGTLDLESTEAIGTTVVIRLPLSA